jgi:hypothetical protein
VTLLRAWHRAWPAYLAIAFAFVATVVVGLTAPSTLIGAFNPVTLNLAVAALAIVDRITLDGIPSAGRCLRRPAVTAAPALAAA